MGLLGEDWVFLSGRALPQGWRRMSCIDREGGGSAQGLCLPPGARGLCPAIRPECLAGQAVSSVKQTRVVLPAGC